MKFLILLLATISYGSPREGGDYPGPKPRSCNQGKLNACIEANRQAQEISHREAALIDDKIAIIRADQKHITSQKISMEEELSSARATRELALAEISESANSSTENQEIFPGGPKPEEIFSLNLGQSIWIELHRSERVARLKTLVNQSTARATSLEPILRKLAMQINNLEGDSRSLIQARESHLATANSHGRMCESGCKENICPEF